MAFTPTTQHVRQLLGAIDPRDTLAVRDRAMLVLTAHTGLRVSELCSLTVDAVSCHGSPRAELAVTGKGRHTRVVPLNSHARTAIAAILHSNARLGLPTRPQSPILFNQYRVPMSPRGVQLVVQRLRERAHLALPFSVHSLRHWFGTELSRRGVSVPVIKELLGHRWSSATDRYTYARPEDKTLAVHQLSRA